LKLLHETIPEMSDNRHFTTLEHFCDQLQEMGSADPIGMFFGMLMNAWDKLVIDWEKFHEQEARRELEGQIYFERTFQRGDPND
jgi:hypothetical protein